MTRKRFVKLLMSQGYSRNEAQELARDAVASGMSYESAYTAARALEYEILPSLSEAVASFTDVVLKLGAALAAATSAFVAAFQDALAAE